MPLSFDGVPASAVGLSIAGLTRWLDAPVIRREYTAVDGLYGAAPSMRRYSEPREMIVNAWLSVASLSARMDALTTASNALAGMRRVRTDDAPTRFMQCEVSPLREVESVSPKIAMTETGKRLAVAFSLTNYHAVSFDEEPRIVALDDVGVPIAVGSAPSAGVLFWGTSSTWSIGVSRTVSYYSNAGVLYGSMTLTAADLSVGTGDHLELDFARRYITHVDSGGTRTNVRSWLSAGGWFAVDAADGDPAAARWPRLAISSGLAQYTYRRAWTL